MAMEARKHPTTIAASAIGQGVGASSCLFLCLTVLYILCISQALHTFVFA